MNRFSFIFSFFPSSQSIVIVPLYRMQFPPLSLSSHSRVQHPQQPSGTANRHPALKPRLSPRMQLAVVPDNHLNSIFIPAPASSPPQPHISPYPQQLSGQPCTLSGGMSCARLDSASPKEESAVDHHDLWTQFVHQLPSLILFVAAS